AAAPAPAPAPVAPKPAPARPSAPVVTPASSGGARPSRIIRRDRPSQVSMPKAAPAPEVPAKAAPASESVVEEEEKELLEEPPEAVEEEVGDKEADADDEAEAEEEEKSAKPRRLSRLGAAKTGDKTEKALRPAERGGRLSSRRVGTTSERLRKRGKEEDAGEADDKKKLEGVADAVSGRSSRRGGVTRTSMRKESAPVLTTKLKIMIGAGLLLVVAVAIAWNPVRKKMMISAIEAGDAAAARDLWAWKGADALEVFDAHIKGQPANVRDAALSGLGEAAKDGSKDALKIALEVLKSGSDEEKTAAAKILVPAAEAYFDLLGKKDDRSKKAAKERMDLLVPVLIEAAAGSMPPDVRLAGIDGLGKLPAGGGGCQLLIKIAKEEKGEPRNHALRGIEMSAVPDAIGDLLTTMSDAEDKELAAAARAGFAKVRDQAETSALIQTLSNPSAEVRLEIVKALATRKGDTAASGGIAKALGDASAPVRLEAVKAVPVMGFHAEDLSKLEPRITDESEDVRVATAETMAALRDDVTWKLLLKSFEKGLEGKTLQAYIKTLGFRGSEKNKKSQRKDMEAIGIVMASMEKNPGSAGSIGEAMVLLTSARGKEAREAERRGWGADKWKSWYANVKSRDDIEKAAMTQLKTADGMKGNFDRYPEAQKLAEDAQTKLEKCQEMCSPNDPEDEYIFKSAIEKLSPLIYEFRKNQHLDLGNGR
ncbi:MAG: HEAT repeat domain-containing protein, partial [Planctomycetota bacterium]|nr:HEAT repeat domain-containing protein [Planctomycetota bacterium]